MIKKLRLKNWRSHKDSEFEFGAGTNVLVGRMGSGKSSAMDALCFALFGTFPALQRREAELDSVIMDKPSVEESAEVEMDFAYAGKEYRVERIVFRGKKTNEGKLYRNGTLIAGPKVSDVSEAVEREIELNYELFSRAVYSEQNQMDYFLRLSPLKRKEKFDELLELDKYEKARKNAVSVKNTIKRIAEERNAQLKSIREGFSEKELLSLEKEISELRESVAGREKSAEEREKELSEEEKSAEELRKKREKFNSLREKSISIKSRIQALGEEIKGIEKEYGEKLGLEKKESIETKGKELAEELACLEEKAKELRETETKLREIRARTELLLGEKKTLSARIPKGMESKENIEREKKKLREKIKGNAEKRGVLKKQTEDALGKISAIEEKKAFSDKRKKEEMQLLQHLEKSGAKCPLCRTELKTKTREELIREKKELIGKLGEEIEKSERERKALSEKEKEIRKKEEEAEREAEELNERRTIIENLAETVERTEEIGKKLRLGEKETKSARERKGELEESAGEKQLEEKRKELERIERALEGIKRFEEISGMEKEQKETEKKIAELEFDEEKALKMEKKIVEKRERLSSLLEGIRSSKSLLEEKGKREKELEKTKELIERLGRKISALRSVDEKMALFVNALKAAQAELRASLIETINSAMESLWKKVYPYRDYESAKIEISQGNYLLKAKTPAGKWVNIEGTLSGGERSAAAVTLRIAFSLVLARNLGWIILDEPTHNLDENAVSRLSEMMRGELPKIVEQVFLITHDKEMEKAANASLYMLKRSGEREGITRAELVPLR